MNNCFIKRPITFSELVGGKMGDDLDAHFKNKAWELQEWTNDSSTGYQVFFGTGVQVDNLYEYGFPYLYDKEELVSFARDFYNRQVVSATYISFWEGGAAFGFPCKVNLATNEVFDIELEAEVLKEYDFYFGASVRFHDGTEFQLFKKGELSHNKAGFWLDESKAFKFPSPPIALDEQIKSAKALVGPPKGNNVSKDVDLEPDF